MSENDEAIAREAYRRWCASDCPGLDEYGDWENHDEDLKLVLSAVGEGGL